MKLTGANTATMVQVIATTASPISSAASTDASYGGWPLRMWRTMFWISTMASSTRMPVTRVMASRLTKLSEKPMICMAANVGMTDNGSATAASRVARQLRRNSRTTMVASTAPSTRLVIAEWKLPRVARTPSSISA